MTQKMPKRAQSLCPVCLRRLDAVYERADDAVLLRKTCPEHGEFAVQDLAPDRPARLLHLARGARPDLADRLRGGRGARDGRRKGRVENLRTHVPSP